MTTDISVGVRWDPLTQQEIMEEYEFEYDGGNSSSRLFERSRIKALASKLIRFIQISVPTRFECKIALHCTFGGFYCLSGVNICRYSVSL